MHSYLPTIPADYTTIELDVMPQRVMPVAGEKFQRVYQTDGGDIQVVTTSTRKWFLVDLQWDFISSTDADKIFDLWNNSDRANGRERTFYWQHPTDGYTYVARFMSDIVMQNFPHAYKTITGVKLRIEGVKPS